MCGGNSSVLVTLSRESWIEKPRHITVVYPLKVLYNVISSLML